jgi:ABC-type Fe3+ transport system substrate-binding protein
MKILGLMIALGSMVTSTGVLGAATGDERVKECVDYYSLAESQSLEVAQKYCSCMNLKMGASETLSVLEWEVLHEAEDASCEKESGWQR